MPWDLKPFNVRQDRHATNLSCVSQLRDLAHVSQSNDPNVALISDTMEGIEGYAMFLLGLPVN